jgi:hypothetical protein
MHEMLNRLADRARFVALKVPVNFDTEKLVRDCNGSLSLALLHKFKKNAPYVHKPVLQ